MRGNRQGSPAHTISPPAGDEVYKGIFVNFAYGGEETPPYVIAGKIPQ